jgi:hypothetical protein
VAYHHRNPVTAGVVTRPHESTWTSHRAYLRLDPAPPWLDVERALSILEFADTAAGRKQFDEFVMEVDLDGAPLAPPDNAIRRAQRGELEQDEWDELIAAAGAIVQLPTNVPLQAKRGGFRARQLVAWFATRDLRQSQASVAARLGIEAGSVSRLIARGMGDADVAGRVAELRRKLGGLPAAGGSMRKAQL